MTESSSTAFIQSLLDRLQASEKFGAIIEAITPFLPVLVGVGEWAVERFIELILEGNTDEAQEFAFDQMTPEERLPVLRQAAGKMTNAAIKAEKLSQDAVGLLKLILSLMIPVLLAQSSSGGDTANA